MGYELEDVGFGGVSDDVGRRILLDGLVFTS